MACLGGLACWPCSAYNWLYRHTQQRAVFIPQPSAQVTRVSVGQPRLRVHCLNERWRKGKGEPQCTCPFPAAQKPTNQTRGVNIPKHQSVSASCQTTIKHMWFFTGLAWDHLLRPVDVCVEMFPAVCAKPVQAGSHVDPSIAMPKHQADRAHGDIGY